MVFYRKKSRILLQLFLTGFAVVFAIFFLVTSLGMPMEGLMQAIFVIAPVIIGGAAAFGFIQALMWLVANQPVIAVEADGLRYGVFNRSESLRYPQIESLRYGTRVRGGGQNGQPATTEELLFIKPKEGKTVEINLSGLDGSFDDVYSAIKKTAPEIPWLTIT
ncbi:hypothetical protein RU97_GL001971 [Enterococcus canis]|uniref:Uncharacterized protein n=2 Tax=Enterococcus canis TaxID=214095 RepID=A0A1L8RFR7_9ENTE|nr:hypothetical protein [Enterococcus canis]OJG18574.1 hypothetical protein RU97_GL001971 [Enterococcus canis]